MDNLSLQQRLENNDKKLDILIQLIAKQTSSVSEPTTAAELPSTSLLSPTHQKTITSHLNQKLFQPYKPKMLLSPLSSDEKAPKDDRTENRTKLLALRQSLPSVCATSSPVPCKMVKKEKLVSIMFVLLGDLRENEVPSTSRFSNLVDAGLGPRKLEIGKHASAIDFEELIDDVATTTNEKPSWKFLYCVSQRPNQTLHPYSNKQFGYTDLQLLKRTQSAKNFYLQPSVTICSLSDDASTGMPLKGFGNDVEYLSQQFTNEESEQAIHLHTDELTFDAEVIEDQLESVGSSHGNLTENISLADIPSSMVGTVEITVTTSNNSDKNITEFDLQNISTHEELYQTIMDCAQATTRIRVDRQFEFPKAEKILEAFQHVDLTPCSSLYVVYANELGIDIGALRKEFFWQSFSALKNENIQEVTLFEGMEDYRTVSSERKLIDKGFYKALATFMLHSYLHTGVLFPGLSEPTYYYIIGFNRYKITEKDCPDYEDQKTAHILGTIRDGNESKLTSEQKTEAQSHLIAYRKYESITKENAARLLKFLYHNAIFLKRLEALNILKDVISSSLIGKFLLLHPEMYSTACPKEAAFKPKPEDVLRSIRNGNDNNNRWTMILLSSFLFKIESYGHTTSEFMMFVTGAPVIDPNNELSLSVSSNYTFITAKSCFNELRVPANIKEDEFVDKMLLALHSTSQSFSLS